MIRTALGRALVVLILFALSGNRFADGRVKAYRSRKLVSSEDVSNGTTLASDDVLPSRFLVKLRPRNRNATEKSSGQAPNRAQSIVRRMRRKVEVSIMQQYDVAFEGFSLETSNVETTLALLDEEYEVMSVYPVVLVPPPDFATIPKINPALLSGDYAVNSSATGSVSTTLASLGLPRVTGADIRVGIIDTGVDYTHPAFQGRVAFRYAFVPDNYVAAAAPELSDNVNDCMGHGTHVAGLIGASFSSPNFRYSGVAPGVTLGAYKVFGCNGSTTSDVILAALDRAAKDNMQIINLSIGIPGTWGGAVADAVERLAQSGTLVVAAIGNKGESGLFLPTSIANMPSVIAVGSLESAAAPAAVRVRIGNPAGADYVLYTRAAYGNLGVLLNAQLQPYTAAADDGCNADSLNNLSGKVAMLTAAGCDAVTKATNAAAAGAVGVILYGDDAALGDLIRLPSSWPLPSFTVPVLAVTLDASTLRNLLRPSPPSRSPSPRPSAARITRSTESTDPTVSPDSIAASSSNPSDAHAVSGGRRLGRRLAQNIGPQFTIVEISGSPVSPSSSWGPSPDLRIKPTVVAPGGYILGLAPGTVPGSPSAGYFAYRSGTSQAAPFVAGALALMLEAGKGRNPATLSAIIARALSTTARPVFDRNVSTISSTLSSIPPSPSQTTSILRVGAGAVDIGALAANRFDVNPARIELGSSVNFGGSATVNVDVVTIGSFAASTNQGFSPFVFLLSHIPAASLSSSDLLVVNKSASGPFNNRTATDFNPQFSQVTASVTFGTSRVSNITSITVPSGGNVRLKVTFSLPATRSPSNIFFSGYLVLRPASNPDPSLIQPTLTVPYLGYSSSLNSIPVLVTAGMSTASGTWVWDDQPGYEDGQKSNEVPQPSQERSPPPQGQSWDSYEYLDTADQGYLSPPDYNAPPSPPLAAPVSSAFMYRLAWTGSRLPSLALFLQRQPLAREIQLWSASVFEGVGTKIGSLRILSGVLPRATNDAPLIINWDGGYVDARTSKDSIITPGTYYFVVRLTRGSAWVDAQDMSNVDVWTSPRFSLYK